MIGPGQTLIRQTRDAVGEVREETCTVVRLYARAREGLAPLPGIEIAELSNGEHVDTDGWFFDPKNPSAWRVVEEKAEPAERTVDEILDDALDLGGRIAHEGSRGYAKEVETLRAELKALVSCENCGEVRDCCRGCDPAHEPRSDR